MSKCKCKKTIKCEDSSSSESESEYENKKILKYYIKKLKNETGDSKCKKYKLVLLEKSVKCGIKCVKMFDII